MPFEIELRGPLTKKEFQELERFLEKNGKFIKKTKRKTFVFFSNETLDLKLRTTNGAAEIVAKKGFWGARKREEVVIPIEKKSFEKAKKFLSFLGYKKGIIAIRENHIFEYKNIEFSLVKCPTGYCFYEAELIKPMKSAEKHIENVLKSLKLRIWPEKEVHNFFMFCRKKVDKHFLLK